MKWSLGLLALLVVCLVGCSSSDPKEGKGSIKVGGKSNFLLPPHHPGYITGDTIMLPEEDEIPAVRTAYCFPGVDVPLDFGVGSKVGEETMAIVPVNINSGATAIGSYDISITSGDPSVALDPDGVFGSFSFLATGSCAARGCPNGCEDLPLYFPNLYVRAPGFEAAPTVSGDSVTVNISATDAGLAPATGVFNLANVTVRVVGDLPYGGVDLFFTVNDLRDRSGNPVTFTPADGVIIEKFRIIYN